MKFTCLILIIKVFSLLLVRDVGAFQLHRTATRQVQLSFSNPAHNIKQLKVHSKAGQASGFGRRETNESSLTLHESAAKCGEKKPRRFPLTRNISLRLKPMLAHYIKSCSKLRRTSSAVKGITATIQRTRLRARAAVDSFLSSSSLRIRRSSVLCLCSCLLCCTYLTGRNSQHESKYQFMGAPTVSSVRNVKSTNNAAELSEILQLTQPSVRSQKSLLTACSNSNFEAREVAAIADAQPMHCLNVARGGKAGSKSANAAIKETVVASAEETKRTLKEALTELGNFLAGPKTDTLILLLATALVTPLCKEIGTSPILGFLAAGMLLGPNGFGLISGIHTTETLAELGIVFFLFEMGIELSVERLMSMKRDVFGLGLGQFTLTALAVAAVGKLAGLPANALVVVGGGLALSSSAFVLQLLKDKDQLATRFGRASFGVLLFQDLAVVPLLVVTPILAGSGNLAKALGGAVVKAAMALGGIAFTGRVVLNPMFKLVAQAKSQEAFLGLVLLTVLSMSFLTEGLGLSNTLGAFLAGVLLSETKYRYQVEADIAPFRGVLLGLFFVTVGFEIDLKLITSNFPLVSAIVSGIILIKTLVTTVLSMTFGLSVANAQQTGLILSQGGEFAFVAFGLARGLGILDPATTKLLLTCIALSMALTPFLAEASGRIAQKLEEKSDFSHYLGQDPEAIEISESDDFVVVAGYGAVGKVVCDLLDAKFIRYVGLEIDPNKAIQARNKGLPVFYGDVGRPEVCKAFNVGKAKAAIVAIADQSETNRVVVSLRRQYPDLKIFARAKDVKHQQRLQKTLDVIAMVAILPEDNLLLTLPFGGAALKALGAPAEEVNAILEGKRKELLSNRGFDAEEEETALVQLGIKRPEDRATKDSDRAKLEVAYGKPEPAPDSMVAQVIVANTIPRTEQVDEKDVIPDAIIESDVSSDVPFQ